MKFTNDYPNKGPIDVRMKTPIYHPKIIRKYKAKCINNIIKKDGRDNKLIEISNLDYNLSIDNGNTWLMPGKIRIRT